MLKQILLASAVVISAPALAQGASSSAPKATTSAPAAGDTAPMTDETTPATPAAPATPATPAQPAAPGASSATPAQPATPAEPAKPAEPKTTAQQQAATPEQIGQIVDKDFASYDKNGDGSLTTAEFGAWMVALRSATEPAFTGQSPADKDWIGKALAMADKDKSGGVSNAELKRFLAPQTAAS